MECEEAGTLLRPLNQGLLGAGVKGDVNRHLHHCRTCRALLIEDLKVLASERLRTLVESLCGDTPEIQQLATGLLHLAQVEEASALLFDTLGSAPRVRLRVDGALVDGPVISRDLYPILVSRFERLALLRRSASGQSVDEQRSLGLETTGQWELAVLRHGAAPDEIVEVDLWAPFRRRIGLERIDLSPETRRLLDGWLDAEGGLILVTGPPDSGRTTLLYSILADRIAEPEWSEPSLEELKSSKIERWGFSVEDPPRIEAAGFTQVHVNRAAGLSFASALRRFIRKDPDLVGVGELSDRETVEVVCSAVLSDHVIVSTSTAAFATGIFDALRGLGAEMSPVAAALTGVIATRLVRRICPACRQACPSPAGAFRARGTVGAEQGTGCGYCRGRGWRGRVAIHETLTITDEIRNLARVGASETAIREHAFSSSALIPFETDAQAKVEEGLTTAEEVSRAMTPRRTARG